MAEGAGQGTAGGRAGVGGGDDPYLFADELGAPYRPDTLSDRFEDAQAAVDEPTLTFDGLRHTSATIALEGLANRAVGGRLGTVQ